VSLGLGSLGGSYGASASSRLYDASASYTFNLTSTRDLSLGLLGMTSYGGGFNSLRFSVTSGATTLVSDTFTSLSAAQAFFTDHAVNLGNFGAGSQTIVVDYALTASAPKGADASYLLSSLAPMAGGSTSTTPPAAAKRGFRPTLGTSIVAGLQPAMTGSALVTRLAAPTHGAAAVPPTAHAIRATVIQPSMSGVTEAMRRDR